MSFWRQREFSTHCVLLPSLLLLYIHYQSSTRNFSCFPFLNVDLWNFDFLKSSWLCLYLLPFLIPLLKKPFFHF